jgi:hypothetical protein
MHHAHEGVVTAISQKIAEIEYRISSAELCSLQELMKGQKNPAK